MRSDEKTERGFVFDESVSAPGAPFYRELRFVRRESRGLPADFLLYADSVWRRDYTTCDRSNFISLNRVSSGTFTVTTEDGRRDCPVGGYVLIREHLRVALAADSPEIRRGMLLFSPEPANVSLFDTLFSAPVTVWRDGSFADAAWERIRRAVGADGFDRFSLNAATWELLSRLSEESQQIGYPPELRRALDYMERHVRRHPAISEVAVGACVSLRTLTRLFREHLNTSPVRHLGSLRMREARNLLLLHPDRRAKEIAEELHFPSPALFSETFRKFYGVSPVRFRRRLSPSDE